MAKFKNAFKSLGKSLNEIFNPNVSLSLKRKQRDLLKELAGKDYGLDIEGLDAGIKTINNLQKRRDNPIFKALSSKINSVRNQVGTLSRQKKSLSKIEVPEKLMSELSKQRDWGVKIKKLNLGYEDDLANLIRLGRQNSAGAKKLETLIGATRRGNKVVDIKRSLVQNKIDKIKYTSARDFNSKKELIDTQLDPLEDRLAALTREKNFNTEDLSDQSFLAQMGRLQQDRSKIAKRQLIAAGLGMGTITGALNIEKESALNKRLTRYFQGK